MITWHIPFRRALLYAVASTALAALHSECHAFSSAPSPATGVGLRPAPRFAPVTVKGVARSSVHLQLFGQAQATGEEKATDRMLPNIVVIRTHEEYVDFLEYDDRLCVIKFYAKWCKSCQRFGLKFRQLASEEPNVRFAELEFSATVQLCKELQIKKLPTVHMHRQGEQVADMVCKPSLFHLVTDEVHRLLDDPGAAIAYPPPVTPSESEPATTAMSEGNVTSTVFDDLAAEILPSLRKKEETVPKKEKSSWFPFTF